MTVTFEIQGVLSAFSVSNLPDLGFSAGDTFAGYLVYDLSHPDLGIASTTGLYYGMELASPFLYLNVEGHEFAVNPSVPIDVTVRDGSPSSAEGDSLYANFQGTGIGFIDVPWDAFDFARASFALSLSDRSGTALASDGLPEAWDLGDWGDEHSITMEGSSPAGGYALNAEITSIHRVPDAAGSLGLFSMALVSLALGYRLRDSRLRRSSL